MSDLNGKTARNARQRRRERKRLIRTAPGTSPGVLIPYPDAETSRIIVTAYGPDGIVEKDVADPREVKPLSASHRVTWAHVIGTRDTKTLQAMGEQFGLHPLALEDVADGNQRPKVEHYGDLVFMVVRLPGRAGTFETEQLSVFLGNGFVVSFEERSPDSLESLRNRIRAPGNRHRLNGPDYLAYSILDTAIDRYFPLLEQLGERLDTLEDEVVMKPTRRTVERIHSEKRDLMTLRRVLWPMRDAMSTLLREDHALISPQTRVYLRDCADHTVQALDLTETYRELGSDLMDIYLSSVSNRMNEIMKVLTIISTIFIPLNFIAGVYGMNFDPHSSPWNMPELEWKYGYMFTLSVMFAVSMGLVVYFWRKGWLTDPKPEPAPPPESPKDAAGR